MSVATGSTNPTAEIARISGLDAAGFRTEVDADLRSGIGRDPRSLRRPPTPGDHLRAAALRSRDLADRWMTTLLQMSVSVEGQLAAAAEDHAATRARLHREIAAAERQVAESKGPQQVAATNKLRDLQKSWELEKEKYASTRAGRLRFKTGLDEWLIEARSVRDSYRNGMYEAVVAEERNHYARVAGDLRTAISEHREHTLADDAIEPSAADEALWAHVQ